MRYELCGCTYCSVYVTLCAVQYKILMALTILSKFTVCPNSPGKNFSTKKFSYLIFSQLKLLYAISSSSRSFSTFMLQEPYQWPSVAAISRKVLGIRYSILPYYYTLFYKASRPVTTIPSATVTRPLFFEFPTDLNTHSIDRQFMVGSGLLVSPVLEQG